MGVNLNIIADHNLDLGQPEKIIDFIKNRIDTSHIDKFYQKLLKINDIRELPPANDVYKIYFNQEKYASWTDALIDTKELGFESALTNIWISQYKVEIHYPRRFFLLSNENLTFTLMQYVFDLISQIGGNEAIFLPDSLPIAHIFLGSVRNPIINQGIPEKPQWKILFDIYDNKIYKTGIPFADIKLAVRTMYGEPSFQTMNLQEKNFNAYMLEDFRSFKLKKIIHDNSIERTQFIVRQKRKTPTWVLKYLLGGEIGLKERRFKQEQLEVSKNYTANQLAMLVDPCYREEFLNICEINNWPWISDIKRTFLEDRTFKNRLSTDSESLMDFFMLIIDKNISLKELYAHKRISKQVYNYLHIRKKDKPEELRRFYYNKIGSTYSYEKITDKNNKLLQEILDFMVITFWADDFRKLTKEKFEQRQEEYKRFERMHRRKKRYWMNKAKNIKS
ncbi:MAG: hypothetical protein EOM90_07380 [Alphaproteobacteria bacterium]|nr:hypothetical protein [Alphaproteobacteria bacterium]